MAGRSWRAQPGYRRKLNHPDHDALERRDCHLRSSGSEPLGEHICVGVGSGGSRTEPERINGTRASTLGKRIHGRCC
jgi:hypothetical protein